MNLLYNTLEGIGKLTNNEWEFCQGFHDAYAKALNVAFIIASNHLI